MSDCFCFRKSDILCLFFELWSKEISRLYRNYVNRCCPMYCFTDYKQKLLIFLLMTAFTVCFTLDEYMASRRGLGEFGSAIHNSWLLKWQGIQVIYRVHVCYRKLYVTICQQDDERDLDVSRELNLSICVVVSGWKLAIRYSVDKFWWIECFSWWFTKKSRHWIKHSGAIMVSHWIHQWHPILPLINGSSWSAAALKHKRNQSVVTHPILHETVYLMALMCCVCYVTGLCATRITIGQHDGFWQSNLGILVYIHILYDYEYGWIFPRNVPSG